MFGDGSEWVLSKFWENVKVERRKEGLEDRSGVQETFEPCSIS
jgi:hypothetical protein